MLQTVTDPRGGVLRLAYDSEGRLAQVNGQVTEARHGPDRRTTAGLTQPGVLGTAERYDQFGLERETAEVERFRNDLAKDIVASDTATARTNPAPLTPWLTSPGGRVHAARGPAGERILLTHDVCGRVVVRRIEQDGFRAKVWTYRWDAFDRMTGCTNPDGETWRYRYDPFGRRVEKRCLSGARRTQAVLGTRFVWDGDLVAEALPITRDGAVEAAAGVTWHFEPGTFRPVAREAAGTGVHYVVNDHLGTPRELTSAESDLAISGRQRLWGSKGAAWQGQNRQSFSKTIGDQFNQSFTFHHDSDLRPFRFQGQWSDDESGLFYNRFRSIDPLSSQYVSPDPIGRIGGNRLHGYTLNTTCWTDPLGLSQWLKGQRFRGDQRSPSEIFESGFDPKGSNLDLRDHVIGKDGSGYVSTTTELDVARGPQFSGTGKYVYEIDPRVGGKPIDYQKLGPSYRDLFAHEMEIPVPGGIRNTDVIGARQVQSDGALGPTIPNPNYQR